MVVVSFNRNGAGCVTAMERGALMADDIDSRTFQVRYFGEDAYHSMDVDALAPALTGYGKLMRETNALLNGDMTKLRVLVASNFEHKCFQLNFELVVRDLLHHDNIQTATDLLKIIGVFRAAGTSLLDFLKQKDGRKIESIERPPNSSNVIVKFHGDRKTVTVTNNVFVLAVNKKVLEAVEGVLGPVEHREANRLQFREDDQPAATFDRHAVRSIIKSCEAGPDPVDTEIEKPNSRTVTATLRLYSPVFDKKAPNWRFLYRGKHKPIYADISETSIAQDAIKRGGSFTNDRYRVRMEVTEPDSDEATRHYKIEEVLDFMPSNSRRYHSRGPARKR